MKRGDYGYWNYASLEMSKRGFGVDREHLHGYRVQLTVSMQTAKVTPDLISVE